AGAGVAGAYGVQDAKLERVHAEAAGDLVDVALPDEPGREGAGGPHLPTGDGIRVAHEGLHAGVRDAVGVHGAPAIEDRPGHRSPGGVGAVVEVDARFVGDHVPLLVDRGAQVAGS